MASLGACLVVAIAFVLFVTHQADHATAQQVALLGNTKALVASQQVTKPSAERQAFMDASDTLTSPFHNVLGTSSAWTLHVSQLLLAFLIYGVGVGFLVRAVLLRRE